MIWKESGVTEKLLLRKVYSNNIMLSILKGSPLGLSFWLFFAEQKRCAQSFRIV